MTLALGFGEVLVLRAGVQDRVVVDQEQVTGFEADVEAVPGRTRRLVDEVEQLDVGRLQAGNVGEALGRLQVGAVVAHAELSPVPGGEGNRMVGALAGSVLPSAVEVMGPVQALDQVGAVRQYGVVHRGGAGEERTSACAWRGQAQQSEHVGPAGVERHRRSRLVAACRRIGEGTSGVAGVTEHVAGSALRHRDTQVLSQPPEQGARRRPAVPLDGDAFDQHEPAAVLQFVGDTLQHVGQGRQREVGGAHLQQRDTALADRTQGGLEFLDLLG